LTFGLGEYIIGAMEIDTIVHGDCLEVMQTFPDKSVDLIVTDPPYGVGLDYGEYQDTQDNLKMIIDGFMPEALRVAKIVMLTCGNSNQYLYPKPDWTMAWVIPAGAGQCSWGWLCWQPILVYGKDPYLANGLGARRDIFISNERSDDSEHPCPKPLSLWENIILRASLNDGDLILDPFLGSGTTAVAAKRLHRHWIGIELSEKYCELARKRVAQCQQPMF